MGKIKLNKDGLKGIFFNHVEKMVLGVVLLVFGVFVYSSLGLEGLPPDQTPDKLIQSAQAAEKNIINPENAKQVQATVTVQTGYVERAKNRLIPTNAVLYASAKPISPTVLPEGSKRQDPKLLPPEKVEVYAMVGGVAVGMKDPEQDVLAKEKNSVATPKVEPVKKKKAKPNDGMGYGYGAGESSGSGDAAGGMGMAGMAGMSSAGMSGMGSAGMMPGAGGDATAAATGGTLASPMDRPGYMATQAGFPTIAKSQSCIAVKAVLPWKRQWEEFESKFSTSLGYNPQRDNPRYLSFTAERLEVSDDAAAPLDWTKAVRVAYTKKTKDEMLAAGYVSWGPEIADPRYLQLGVLTMPLPPFINRNLEGLALHSEVPKAAVNPIAVPGVDKDGKKKKIEKKKTGEDSDEPADAPAGVSPDGFPAGGMAGMGEAGSSGMPGMAGMSSAGMSGMGGMPGMSSAGMSGMGGMPGMSSAGMTGMGMASSDGTGGMSGMSGAEGMGMSGMPGMSGMSGYGYGSGDSGMAMNRGPVVPYLLIRFFDFSAEPGKKYRYRVQAYLEDPNHPQFSQMEPSDRYLDDTVKARLQGQVATDEKAKKQRQYFVKTDWSEHSAPIGIEIRPRSLAGQVAALKLGAAPDKTFQDKLLLDEPQAKVMSVVWDATHATEVTGVTDVFRGTFLNFKSNGDAIHPVMLLFKSLEKYDFQTEQLVADIRGGEELAKEKDRTLLSPGQYALIDDRGQIIVRNEFDDWDDFRKLTLPEGPDTAVSAYPGSMGGEEGGGMSGYPGMPGSAKKGRSGRSSGSSSGDR